MRARGLVDESARNGHQRGGLPSRAQQLFQLGLTQNLVFGGQGVDWQLVGPRPVEIDRRGPQDGRDPSARVLRRLPATELAVVLDQDLADQVLTILDRPPAERCAAISVARRRASAYSALVAGSVLGGSPA